MLFLFLSVCFCIVGIVFVCNCWNCLSFLYVGIDFKNMWELLFSKRICGECLFERELSCVCVCWMCVVFVVFCLFVLCGNCCVCLCGICLFVVYVCFFVFLQLWNCLCVCVLFNCGNWICVVNCGNCVLVCCCFVLFVLSWICMFANCGNCHCFVVFVCVCELCFGVLLFCVLFLIVGCCAVQVGCCYEIPTVF